MAQLNEEKETGGADGADMLSLGVHSTKDDRIKISVIPPAFNEKTKRSPVIICCVVDTSGSMGCDAIIKDVNGKEESHGLSILDLVKHSIKTIIECLNKDDYISIISYNDKAEVITNLMQMNKKNKKKTLESLDKLQADGQTKLIPTFLITHVHKFVTHSLWDGLFNGLEQLRRCKEINCQNHNATVMLFTDGLPNISPPKGEIAMVKKYMSQHKHLNACINTYGFGYSLDTKLLTRLAVKGSGTYAFIPDSSFVGTIFCSSISNICSNVAKNVKVKIGINFKKYEPEVIGGYDYIQSDDGIEINLGNVMYGQNKDMIIRMESLQNNEEEEPNTNDKEGDAEGNNQNEDPFLFNIGCKSLQYISLKENKFVNSAYKMYDDDDGGKNKLTEIHYYRLRVCDVLRECMNCCKINDYDEAQQNLKDLIKTIKRNKVICKEEYIMDLITDLTGQSFEAISKKEYYDKWGKHYLPSLIFAHLHQYNNNFKDPGIQHYGGKLFNALRDKANDIFIKMPAPKPSYKAPDWLKNFQDAQPQVYGHQSKGKAKKKKAVNMSHYMNKGGGCFGEECMVQMDDASVKMVKDLCFGDVVAGGAKVECVIKYECKNGKNLLCTFDGGLKITPYHPIKVNDEWIFPINADDSVCREESCEFVYNVVLSDVHILNVNGVECCTLGHGLMENEVIKHEYLGTTKVVDDLKKCSGWKQGRISLKHDAFKRDEITNMICAISH